MPAIRVVLLRKADNSLEQQALSAEHNSQIDNRIDRIDKGPSQTSRNRLKEAQRRSERLHGGVHNHRMIVLSVQQQDEIEWVVKNQKGGGETGFTVYMTPLTQDAPPKPFDRLLHDGGTGIVKSGPAVPEAAGHHYDFMIVMDKDKAAMDPDCYISD